MLNTWDVYDMSCAVCYMLSWAVHINNVSDGVWCRFVWSGLQIKGSTVGAMYVHQLTSDFVFGSNYTQ